MKIHEEDGQALLLALAFLVFFGLVIAAMLTFAGASVFASERLREQRDTIYAADGATDAAIQYARLNPDVGAYGTVPCMETPEFSTTASTADGTVATVYCTFLQDVEQDREVEFRACVDDAVVVVATVRYYDHNDHATPPGPVAEVLSWTSSGATGECVDGYVRP